MVLGAEPPDHATKQAVLHTDLHQQREIDERDHLEGAERAAHVLFAAKLARKEQPRAPGLAYQAGLLQHTGPIFLGG